MNFIYFSHYCIAINYETNDYEKFLLTFIVALALFQSINAQGLITAVPCNMLGMVMNVGSKNL